MGMRGMKWFLIALLCLLIWAAVLHGAAEIIQAQPCSAAGESG